MKHYIPEIGIPPDQNEFHQWCWVYFVPMASDPSDFRLTSGEPAAGPYFVTFGWDPTVFPTGEELDLSFERNSYPGPETPESGNPTVAFVVGLRVEGDAPKKHRPKINWEPLP